MIHREASAMLLGRVGDSPLPGCGYFAAGGGAIAATGLGEEIIRRMLSREVHDLIRSGRTAEEACRSGIAAFPEAIPVGLIAMTAHGYAIAANRQMAAWAAVKES